MCGSLGKFLSVKIQIYKFTVNRKCLITLIIHINLWNIPVSFWLNILMVSLIIYTCPNILLVEKLHFWATATSDRVFTDHHLGSFKDVGYLTPKVTCNKVHIPETKKMVLIRWLWVSPSCCRHRPWDRISGMAMIPPNAVRKCCET